MKKTITIFAVVVVLLMTIMMQTVFATTVTEKYYPERTDEIMPTFTGVIGSCPRCGKASLHTCAGPSGFFDTDKTCTTHLDCLLTGRELYYTKAECQQCGYGLNQGGGSGIFDMHVQTYTHSCNGEYHNFCIYTS